MARITKRLLACAVVGVLVFTSVSSGAWDKKGDKGQRSSERMEKWAEELGLSAEQKEALKEARDSSKTEKDLIWTRLKTAREDLNKELKKPETDQAAVEKAVLEIKKAQGDLVDYRVKSFLSMKGVLTEEQFQKMAEIKERRGDRKNERKRRKGVNTEKITSDE
jgi:Spy/CpxP family protein refolding chaperone